MKEPNESFQKQLKCGQFPVVDVIVIVVVAAVVGLPSCYSPPQVVKLTQLQ